MLGNLKGPHCGRITPPAGLGGGEASIGQLVKYLECQKQMVWTWYRAWWEVTMAFKQGVPCHVPRHCTGIWES